VPSPVQNIEQKSVQYWSLTSSTVDHGFDRQFASLTRVTPRVKRISAPTDVQHPTELSEQTIDRM
jgi:hypothetical protein